MKLVPVLTDILQMLQEHQPILARMSGSGATCFALFDSLAKAKKVERRCKEVMNGIWTLTGKIR